MDDKQSLVLVALLLLAFFFFPLLLPSTQPRWSSIFLFPDRINQTMSSPNSTSDSSSHLRQRSQLPTIPTDSDLTSTSTDMLARTNNSINKDLKDENGHELRSIQMEGGEAITNGKEKDTSGGAGNQKDKEMSKKDRDAILLLVVLCELQLGMRVSHLGLV